MSIGILSALISACLFGASTPFAKLLVGDISPWLLAGLLYLGSGIGLSLVRFLSPRNRTSLARDEWLWLVGAIHFGGILGPLLLMWGLSHTPGSTASLLLNVEGVLTALLAWFAFRENFDRRIALGMAAIVAGTVVLSWPGDSGFGLSWGALAVIGACLCWALDNNLTRKVSLSDPIQIAAIKGLAAGSVNTLLAFAASAPLPAFRPIGAALAVGFLGYGVSLSLFVVGLRHLGTARAGAYFSIAPFVGAVLAVLVLGEAVTSRQAVAAALMLAGVWLHLTERHAHEHAHEAVEHEHAHAHDEHHAHDHAESANGRHSHPHCHEQLRHSHPHYPDAHHRHRH